MRNFTILKFSLSILLLSALGCSHMNIDSSNSESSIFIGGGNESANYIRMGEFSVVKAGGWLFWGTIKIGHPDVGKMIDIEVSKLNGNGVIHLEIKSERRIDDVIIGFFTYFFYTRRSIQVSGVVVRYTDYEGSLLGD